MFKRGLLALSAGVLLAFSANGRADETWSTNVGRIIYAQDMGPTAVFTYGPKDDQGVIYLLGLAKVYTNRGIYDGYWAKNTSKVECSTERPGLNGKMTKYWGRIQVKFIDKDFPSRWDAIWTYCNDEKQSVVIQATPEAK